MSVRNIDKGFLYAPTHIQIPYTGGATGTIDVYNQVMGYSVTLYIPQFSFVVAVRDNIYIQLPIECR